MQIQAQELRKLLTGQVPADFADWLDFVAIGALLAFAWQAEPQVFAILAVSMGLPYVIIGPFAGILVDRIDTRQVLIWSNLGRALMTAGMFFAANWPMLMVLIALRSSVDTFFTPAKQSALLSLTGPDTRMRANALSHAINQASKALAPALGGVLLLWVAPEMVFVFNALLSVLAALLLMRLQPLIGAASAQATPRQSPLSDIRGGLKMVLHTPVLRASIGMMAAGFFAMFFYDTLIAPLTRDMGFSQTHLGLSLAAVGIGGVIGAGLMAHIGDLKRPFLAVAFGSALSGICVFGLGFAEVTQLPLNLTIFAGAFLLLGISTALALVPIRTLLQNNSDAENIGQITAISEAVNMLALLSAPFIGAWFAAQFSIGAAFLLGGGVMLLVALWALVLRNTG